MFVLIAAGLVVAVTVTRREPLGTERLYRQAEAEFTARRFDKAWETVQRALETNPQHPQSLLLAATIAAQRHEYAKAVGYYQLAGETSEGSQAGRAHALCGDLLLFHIGDLSEAEQQFRLALDADARNLIAHSGLATLLHLQGRRWESRPHLLELVRQDSFSLDTLLQLAGEPVGLVLESGLGETASVSAGETRIARAQSAAEQLDFDTAEKLLRSELEAHPDRVEAYARLGEILLARKDFEGLLRWVSDAPQDADSHPGVWRVRGQWAETLDAPTGAIRCLAEAVLRDPNDLTSVHRLARNLLVLGADDLAEAAQVRSIWLSEFHGVSQTIIAEPDETTALRRAGELCEQLGRSLEAWGWYQLLLSLNAGDAEAGRAVERLEEQLDDSHSETVATGKFVAANRIVREFSLPIWEKLVAGDTATLASDDERRADRVTLVDEAEQMGVNFTYLNGDDPTTPGKRMQEVTGGGVGVLDYDADGWPDLVLSQGGRWPVNASRNDSQDHLYRNLGTGRFSMTAEKARVIDRQFGQGVAVGDFDDDGFPDLLVAAAGRNSLYRNNGDGTFHDVTDSQLGGDDWTTSCLLADLNGDALPDVYAVNYLAGEDVFERICEGDGRRRSCSPRVFPAAQDRLFLNLGDGRFKERTTESGITIPNGNGLGIVAADFDGSGRLSLFVANDQVPNFFFHNRTRPAGAQPSFEETAIVSGLAVDADGRPQACMGVAAGDADGDGQLDLFVTNFFNEANTLYVRQPPVTAASVNFAFAPTAASSEVMILFADRTRRAGLFDGGVPLLGFGAQFLDAELDGLPDLVTVNGHVDDYRFQGTPYRMRPQYYANIGEGRFREIRPSGEFFETAQLGRSLAVWDWNRDGKEDLVVSHLDTPAAVLTNHTQATGRSLTVRLRGSTTSRDAIGSVVRVETANQVVARQLTAGNGYQCSNERLLVFGLGNAERVERLSVRWPSGREEAWRNLDVDSRLVIVEGQGLFVGF